MPRVCLWIHFVWSTKGRQPWLSDSLRPVVLQHIRENAELKGIIVDCINGWVDHVHCLVALKNHQSVAQVAQLLKGESSHWVNSNGLVDDGFEWQDEYYAVSVSESSLVTVRAYIEHQDEHHRGKPSGDFCAEVLEGYWVDVN
jgi:putative transposase